MGAAAEASKLVPQTWGVLGGSGGEWPGRGPLLLTQGVWQGQLGTPNSFPHPILRAWVCYESTQWGPGAPGHLAF